MSLVRTVRGERDCKRENNASLTAYDLDLRKCPWTPLHWFRGRDFGQEERHRRNLQPCEHRNTSRIHETTMLRHTSAMSLPAEISGAVQCRNDRVDMDLSRAPPMALYNPVDTTVRARFRRQPSVECAHAHPPPKSGPRRGRVPGNTRLRSVAAWRPRKHHEAHTVQCHVKAEEYDAQGMGH